MQTEGFIKPHQHFWLTAAEDDQIQDQVSWLLAGQSSH
jgi:hypothetical protein